MKLKRKVQYLLSLALLVFGFGMSFTMILDGMPIYGAMAFVTMLIVGNFALDDILAGMRAASRHRVLLSDRLLALDNEAIESLEFLGNRTKIPDRLTIVNSALLLYEWRESLADEEEVKVHNRKTGKVDSVLI
jgi:hypothetical protein